MGQREKSKNTRSVMVVSGGGSGGGGGDDKLDEDKGGAFRVVERVDDRRRERRVRVVVVEAKEKKGGVGIGDRGEAMREKKTWPESDRDMGWGRRLEWLVVRGRVGPYICLSR